MTRRGRGKLDGLAGFGGPCEEGTSAGRPTRGRRGPARAVCGEVGAEAATQGRGAAAARELDGGKNQQDGGEDAEHAAVACGARGGAGVHAANLEEVGAVVQHTQQADLRDGVYVAVAHEVEQRRLAVHAVRAQVAALVRECELLAGVARRGGDAADGHAAAGVGVVGGGAVAKRRRAHAEREVGAVLPSAHEPVGRRA